VMLFDNSEENPIFVMKQIKGESMNVFKESTFQKIKQNLKNGFKAVNFWFYLIERKTPMPSGSEM
jgi:hypothetical protein